MRHIMNATIVASFLFALSGGGYRLDSHLEAEQHRLVANEALNRAEQAGQERQTRLKSEPSSSQNACTGIDIREMTVASIKDTHVSGYKGAIIITLVSFGGPATSFRCRETVVSTYKLRHARLLGLPVPWDYRIEILGADTSRQVSTDPISNVSSLEILPVRRVKLRELKIQDVPYQGMDLTAQDPAFNRLTKDLEGHSNVTAEDADGQRLLLRKKMVLRDFGRLVHFVAANEALRCGLVLNPSFTPFEKVDRDTATGNPGKSLICDDSTIEKNRDVDWMQIASTRGDVGVIDVDVKSVDLPIADTQKGEEKDDGALMTLKVRNVSQDRSMFVDVHWQDKADGTPSIDWYSTYQ